MDGPTLADSAKTSPRPGGLIREVQPATWQIPVPTTERVNVPHGIDGQHADAWDGLQTASRGRPSTGKPW